MSRSFEITIFNCFKFNSPFFNWQGVGEEVGRETAEGSGQAREHKPKFFFISQENENRQKYFISQENENRQKMISQENENRQKYFISQENEKKE